MSLAQLLFFEPTEQGFHTFEWANYTHHQAIINAAARNQKTALIMYPIFPINPDDIETWLEAHQEMHSQMTALYDIVGSDLSVVDFQDKGQREAWTYLHFTEHRVAAARSGAAI